MASPLASPVALTSSTTPPVLAAAAEAEASMTATDPTSTSPGAPTPNSTHSSYTSKQAKYLCSAPRPEQWEEHAVRVLAALASSLATTPTTTRRNSSSSGKNPQKRTTTTTTKAKKKKSRYKTVLQTVKKIRAAHKIEPRAGRGRKSNAQHALQFYEYLLERIQQEDGSGSDDDDDDDDDEEEAVVQYQEEYYEEEEVGGERTGGSGGGVEEDYDNPHQPHHHRHHDRSAEQQDTLCRVCEETTGNDSFLACTTCPYVFHFNCVRPEITAAEQKSSDFAASYRCAYCILPTEAKHTKPRRIAAAAVRLMARLKNQHKRHKASEERRHLKQQQQQQPKQQQQKPKPTPAGTTSNSMSPSQSKQKKAPKEEAVKAEEEVVVKESSQKPEPPALMVSTKNPEQPALKESSTKPETPAPEVEKAPSTTTTSSPTKIITSPTRRSSRVRDDKGNDSQTTPTDAAAGTFREKKPRPPLPPRGKGGRFLSTPRDSTEKPVSSKKSGSSKKSKRQRKRERKAEAKAPKEESQTKKPDPDKVAKPETSPTVASTSGGAPHGTGKPKDIEPAATASPSTPTRHKKMEGKILSSDSPFTTTPPPASATSSPGKKRNLTLFQISDSLSPGFRLEDGGRGKRSRKQPALFDPQTVAAGKWQSDEFPRNSDNEDDDDESASTAMSRENDADAEEEKVEMTKSTTTTAMTRRTHHHHRGDGGASPWCNFCNDDPSIPICCFCACRVCYGKHRLTEMLLCDFCDDEYHTFCLDPPLIKLPPANQKWYCPSCCDSQEKRTARASSRARDYYAPISTTTSSSTTVTGGATKKTEVITGVRRTSRTPAIKQESPPPSPVRAPVPGRKPGRPRLTEPSASTTNVKRGRGRPPKSLSPSSKSPPVPRKRGRPAKSTSPSKSDSKKTVSKSHHAVQVVRAESVTGDEGTPSSETSIPVKSRSGRTVKRSSFHDEIDEADQHLRGGGGGGRYSDSPFYQTTFMETKHSADESARATTATAPAQSACLLQVGGSSVAFKLADHNAALSNALEHAKLGPETPGKSPVPPTPANTPLVISISGTNAVGPVLAASAAAALAASASRTGTTRAASVLSRRDSFTSRDASSRVPRRKPGARECMQLSRRFGASIIADEHMEVLLDYSQRGKVEHLVRMRERLDDHARFLELQLAGLEALVQQNGESDVKVPPGVVMDEMQL